MYKAIGINMDKEYKALRKKSKRFVPPSHYRDNYSLNNSKEDNVDDYSFFDSMEDLKDCANSNDKDCKIKSCLLNKEIQVNKKVLIASCIGAAAGIIGVTCAMKKMNSKSNRNFLAAAPSLMKFAKTML
ncbi:MAG: hypothetical protein E7D79_02235 [Clostridium perfringens]|uniref:Uncharacterized protein n=1 Tax=Clostridium perfringens TaxID=1502 RepID=A0A133NFA3_CLOPF|nr:hypothetical protein [Clostridium perfringens]ELC8418301.1 hypothetical protein [Clostridium perfringens]KXA14953.1 hypothetical protein HMPREF3222_00029 [Clostridium perfringens]MBO3355163.1 hypothetical protein [Clostridium perfringens]MBO3358434.1 hypothetical protein [Clostridium perfringens]MBS5920926.1 hypothetical protein [Clostridium perfringens]